MFNIREAWISLLHPSFAESSAYKTEYKFGKQSEKWIEEQRQDYDASIPYCGSFNIIILGWVLLGRWHIGRKTEKF